MIHWLIACAVCFSGVEHLVLNVGTILSFGEDLVAPPYGISSQNVNGLHGYQILMLYFGSGVMGAFVDWGYGIVWNTYIGFQVALFAAAVFFSSVLDVSVFDFQTDTINT